MKPEAVAQAERVLGDTAAGWTPFTRGYTPAERWLVRFADGSSAFVKAAVNDDTAAWLRSELVVYSALEAGFLPRFLGWDEGLWPALVLEDLSTAVWPPPWSSGSVAQVLTALDAVSAAPPPDGLSRLEDLRALLDGWPAVAADPGPFLSLGLCTAAWLEAVLPALIEASSAAVLGGDKLLHLDVRSDNICFRAGGAVLVDWNHAVIGNPMFDLAFWLPSLAMEGGPEPDELAGDAPDMSDLAALSASYFAARAGLPPVPAAPGVRPLQLAQLRVALPWALRALELPPLDR